MKKSLVVLTVLSALALAGCGQTGPLYMPKDSSTNSDAQATAQSNGVPSTTTTDQADTQSEQ